MSRKIEPCSICERYMDGVICEEKECPVAIMKEEIERLKEKAKGFRELWCDAESDLRTAKSEAIKEFAERLRGKAHFSEDFGEAAVACCDIDNIVKEMTEGEK